MPLTVNNNTYLFSNKSLNKNQKTLQTVNERLSSAKRNNHAADGFFSVDISTANGAETAISALDASLDTLNRNRSEYGATANRLESAGSNLQTENETLTASRSRIEDGDYAVELARQTSSLIMQNAGLANLTQASVSSQMVNRLLK